MPFIDSLMERNKRVAAHRSPDSLMPSLPRALPNVKAVIIGCADMRVDPADIFDIVPGEVVVMRNIGGRVTPGLLEQIAMLARIGEVAGAMPGGGAEFNVIVLHHTDCGITRLHGDPSMLAHYFRVAEETLSTKAVNEPRTAVAVDLHAIRATHALPPSWLLSGLVYDVTTGIAEIVVPPTPFGAA